MNRIAAAILFTALSASAAGVPPKFGLPGYDITDLWFNHNEPGWGMNVIRQSDTSFATLFVYGADGQPTWYVASNIAFDSVDTATGDVIHVGKLYKTTGPAFTAGTFNPSAVTVREVGTLTLRVRVNRSVNALYAGTLIYTIDGVTYTKDVERESWRVANHTGSYDGYLRETFSGCTNTAANGEFSTPGTLTISQSAGDPPAMTLKFVSEDGLLTYTMAGAYYQAGRSGSLPNLALTRVYPNGSDSATGYGIDLSSGTTGFSGEFHFANITALPGCTTFSRIGATR